MQELKVRINTINGTLLQGIVVERHHKQIWLWKSGGFSLPEGKVLEHSDLTVAYKQQLLDTQDLELDLLSPSLLEILSKHIRPGDELLPHSSQHPIGCIGEVSSSSLKPTGNIRLTCSGETLGVKSTEIHCLKQGHRVLVYGEDWSGLWLVRSYLG